MTVSNEQIAQQMRKIAEELGALFEMAQGDEFLTTIDLQQVQHELITGAANLADQ